MPSFVSRYIKSIQSYRTHRICSIAALSIAAGLLAALPVLLWMARGNFPGDVPVAMLYLTLLTLVEAWFLSAESAVRS